MENSATDISAGHFSVRDRGLTAGIAAGKDDRTCFFIAILTGIHAYPDGNNELTSEVKCPWMPADPAAGI